MRFENIRQFSPLLNRIQYNVNRLQECKSLDGGIAQLGEHLPCKQGVKGSNPFISTADMVTGNNW